MEPGVEWRAVEWRDGASYDGLVKDRRPHSHGVLRFPNKDRYEGQFTDGRFDGYGVYVWADGTVYRGEWMQGEMHGCGIKLWRDDDGEPTATPRQQSPTTPPSAPPANAVTVRAAEGRFARDLFAGPGLSPCDDPQSALDAAVEADYAAAQARSFAERRRQQMGAVSAGKSRGGGAAPTVVRGGRPPLGRAEEEQKKSKGQSGGGWFGGLFGGHKDDAPLPANTRVRANDDGGPGALASLGQGDRALLTALVDRVVAHEVALAMAAEVDAAPAAAAAGVAAAAGGGGGGGRPS